MKRPVIWTATGLYLIFLMGAWLVPNRALMESLRAFLLAISVAVVVAYARPALQAVFAARRPDLVEQLTLGIALAWGTTVIQSGWYMMWRLAGQPPWMVNNDFNALLLYSLCLAACLHITAPGAVDGVIPRRNMIVLGVAVGIAALLVSFLVLFNPDVTQFLEHFKWLADPDDVERSTYPRRVIVP